MGILGVKCCWVGNSKLLKPWLYPRMAEQFLAGLFYLCKHDVIGLMSVPDETKMKVLHL